MMPRLLTLGAKKRSDEAWATLDAGELEPLRPERRHGEAAQEERAAQDPSLSGMRSEA
jgi:hypothetical protein